MTRRTFANELEKAARHCPCRPADPAPTSCLAAEKHEGLALDEDADDAIDLLAADLGLSRSEVLQTIVRDWLISGGRLPVDTLDEDSETDRTA